MKVCDIQFNKFNRTLAKGEFNRKNEVKDGMFSQVRQEDVDIIQARLRKQIEDLLKDKKDESK